ncbi:MAG: tetratricopeptide repeat protein [Candidatus Eisenbacteria bacterium]
MTRSPGDSIHPNAARDRLVRMRKHFEELRDLTSPDREAALDALRATDAELANAVRDCLDAFGSEEVDEGSTGAQSTARDTQALPLFAGRYLLQDEIGAGGMGTVYRAWDAFLDIPVALKTLRSDLVRSGRADLQLKKELLSARLVTHRNVCRVFDSGVERSESGARWFLTMELLTGETLMERIRQRGPMSAKEALPIVAQLVEGLASAHRAGVVHLDLKTSNVMLASVEGEAGASGTRAVIMDFGIARMPAAARASADVGVDAGAGGGAGIGVGMGMDVGVDVGDGPGVGVNVDAGAGVGMATEPGMESVGGTLGYMAPEQMFGVDVGPRADIYALGVVLHEMRTGKLPAPESPAHLEPDWRETIERCLADDPHERFARVEEVARALGCGSSSPSFRSGIPTRSIPSELDTFIGRDADLQAIADAHAQGTRLLTLVGPAGVGKTRLAVHYANDRKSDWEGGTWFAGLADVSESALLAAISSGLGVPAQMGVSIERITQVLSARGRCLVVIDNVDSLLSACRPLLSDWLESTEATFLLTSRERLAVRGEVVHSVEPLEPDDAVQLFVDRARRARPGFAPTTEDMGTVSRVVRIVDALPLAIELAAARVGVVGLSTLESHLEDRLRVLSTRMDGRHASLRSAIDESWSLLDEYERRAWTQCAVFEGGIHIDAAEAVLDLGEGAPWTVDVVHSLVDKSLLHTKVQRLDAIGVGGSLRIEMYPSLREYALEKLRIADADAWRRAYDAHMDYFLELTGRLGTGAKSNDGDDPFLRLSMDADNLVVACRTALETQNEPAMATLFWALHNVIMRRGDWTGGLGRECLAACTQTGPRGRILAYLGRIQWTRGLIDDALRDLTEALPMLRESGHRRDEASVLGNLAAVYRTKTQLQRAIDYYGQAIQTAQEVGDPASEAIIRNGIGALHYERGDLPGAKDCYLEAIRLSRTVGHVDSEAIALSNLGGVYYTLGKPDEALEVWQQGEDLFRRTGDLRHCGVLLHNLGLLRYELGRSDEAQENFERSLAILSHIGDRASAVTTHVPLGLLAQERGDLEQARHHIETALTMSIDTGNKRMEALCLGSLGDVARESGELDEARVFVTRSIDIHRTTDGNRYLGPVLGYLGHLELTLGRLEEARSALGEGETVLRQVGDRPQLARLLFVRGLLDLEAGNTERASAALGEMEEIGAELGCGEESPIGKRLDRLRDAIQGTV